jgi:hypothetical protein
MDESSLAELVTNRMSLVQLPDNFAVFSTGFLVHSTHTLHDLLLSFLSQPNMLERHYFFPLDHGSCVPTLCSHDGTLKLMYDGFECGGGNWSVLPSTDLHDVNEFRGNVNDLIRNSFFSVRGRTVCSTFGRESPVEAGSVAERGWWLLWMSV